MLACMQSLENACMHAIIVGRAWEGTVSQIFDNEQKQAFSAFEMEEEQNATVHVLVLVLELMLSK